MDKTLAGVLGAVGALAVTQAHAAPAQVPNADAALQAASYADLLNPIPNALDVLAAEPAIGTDPAPGVQDVQWHHHHHHHGWLHHHHHHHGWYGYGYGYNPYGYYGGYYRYGYAPYGYRYGYYPYGY